MFILGLFITIDDVIEHTITSKTPLRLFFSHVMIPFMNIINKMINKVR